MIFIDFVGSPSRKSAKNHEKIKNERVNADFWRIHKNRRFEEGFWFFPHFSAFSWIPVQQKSEKIWKHQKSLPNSLKSRLHLHEIIEIREETRKKSTSKCHEIIEMKEGVENLCEKTLTKSCWSLLFIIENAAAGQVFFWKEKKKEKILF